MANAELTIEEVHEAIGQQIATSNSKFNAFDSLAQDIAPVQDGAQLVGKRGAGWDLLHVAKELSILLPKVSLEGYE